jgi:hypothetical protein
MTRPVMMSCQVEKSTDIPRNQKQFVQKTGSSPLLQIIIFDGLPSDADKRAANSQYGTVWRKNHHFM